MASIAIMHHAKQQAGPVFPIEAQIQCATAGIARSGCPVLILGLGGDRRHLPLKDATRASASQVERRLILEVLASTGGNQKRAAADRGDQLQGLAVQT